MFEILKTGIQAWINCDSFQAGTSKFSLKFNKDSSFHSEHKILLSKCMINIPFQLVQK